MKAKKKGQVDGESVRKKLEQSKNAGTSKCGRRLSWSKARMLEASEEEVGAKQDGEW